MLELCNNVLSLAALKERATKSFFKLMRSLPYVKGKIEKEMSSTARDIEESFNKNIGDEGYMTHLPKEGMSEVNVD